MRLDWITIISASRDTGWQMWPFGPGYGGGFWQTVSRFGISLLFLLLIAGLLRFLFGPGGPLRPPEFGTEHIEERKKRKQELKELKARFKRGEIDVNEYLDRKTELYKDE